MWRSESEEERGIETKRGMTGSASQAGRGEAISVF